MMVFDRMFPEKRILQEFIGTLMSAGKLNFQMFYETKVRFNS